MANRAHKPVPQRKPRIVRLWCWLWFGHDRSERRFESGPLKQQDANYKPNKYQWVYCSKCGEIIGRKLINGKA